MDFSRKPRIGVLLIGAKRFKPLGEGTARGSYEQRKAAEADSYISVFSGFADIVFDGPVYEREEAEAAVPADNAKQVGDRAAAGDGNARRIYLETGELLGEVVRPILLQYGVQAFILGGQISKSFSLMEPGLRQALAGLGQLKYIAAAEDIDNVHLYGAALA